MAGTLLDVALVGIGLWALVAQNWHIAVWMVACGVVALGAGCLYLWAGESGDVQKLQQAFVSALLIKLGIVCIAVWAVVQLARS